MSIEKDHPLPEVQAAKRPPLGLGSAKQPHALVRETPKAYIWFAWFLKVASITYLLILVMMIALETRLVFPGASATIGDWSHAGITLEDVQFPSSDGTEIFGNFFPNPSSEKCLLFCHGNGENIAMIASEMDLLRKRLNVSVLSFDYRGFGKTKGSPSEEAIIQDAEAASQWLANRTQKSPESQIIMGRSLGGGVAVQLAAVLNPQALILDRTFSSTVDVAADLYWWLPIRIVMRNQFWSSVRIKKYDGPLFQMHGDVDEVIPLWSALKLFENSPSADKTFMEVPGLFHNDPWPSEFINALSEFVGSLDELSSSTSEVAQVLDTESSLLNAR